MQPKRSSHPIFLINDTQVFPVTLNTSGFSSYLESVSQLTLTGAMLTIETQEKGVKYVPS